MNRTTISLIGATVALAAVTGIAVVTGPDGAAAPASPQSASRRPVERSALLCPAPSSSEVGETTYTSFTPKGTGTGTGAGTGTGTVAKADGHRGTAVLTPAPTAKDGRADAGKTGKDSQGNEDSKGKKPGRESGTAAAGQGDAKPVAPLAQAGKPVTATTDRADAPALVGTAEGTLAPGWSVQQTTAIAAGGGRGLQGLTCTAPDTSFWFPGVSTEKGRQDYVHLTNPDATPAVVDLELRGKSGSLASASGEGITVPPHSTLPVLLSTLTAAPTPDAALHVAAREGRVGASVQAADAKLGGDWLPAAADPGPVAVLPGIPADATSVHLVAVAPGDADADLKVQLATPSGLITPAGLESLRVKSGMTASVELGGVTKGEAGSLVLTPANGSKAPVAAALRVTRGTGGKQEMAFLPATRPVGARATVADNRAKGGTLSLTAPEKGKDAKVKVTASAGSGGGEPVSKTYTVRGGSTLAVEPPVPPGLRGSYALTVEPAAGGGPVYASRTLTLPQGGLPAFTIQTLPDDRGTVVVPGARQDLSLLLD
ncbi:DUF5719 family protein [Streptomyces sp. MST-110588]|uniref:DUF5719 family protein n=1 Tax=Streptomyces sp. MST-110588 TaxID=2833628 RepID=UPI001F5CA3A6|nr:DUF5719 family protein [Streptomyces sp. MST-110588]UNO41693.1 hypothetical protein KGS77_21760 [Streptomyces sp. MST-110588]